jgi:hypothetical protein
MRPEKERKPIHISRKKPFQVTQDCQSTNAFSQIYSFGIKVKIRIFKIFYLINHQPVNPQGFLLNYFKVKASSSS